MGEHPKMKGSLTQKTVVLLITCLLTITNVTTIDKKVSGSWNTHSILYVGGIGPSNYTKIQDAIDNPSDDYTIYVHAGIYQENIKIDKQIMLIGENRNSTIIKGTGYKDVVKIENDKVTITNFTIQNSGLSGRDAGIEILGNKTNIHHNILNNCTIGLYLYHSTNNIIYTNSFISNRDYGIFLHYSHNNTISHNKFLFNRWGIYLIYSIQNTITNNNINSNLHKGIWISRISHYNNISNNIIHSNGDYGIFLYRSNTNTISKNTISNNCNGIYPFYAGYNIITQNNFISNTRHAAFKGADNAWDENFWGKERKLPKIIVEYPIVGIPNINYDWHPAKTPINTSDLCALSTVLNNSICALDSITNQNCDLPSYFSWKDIKGIDFTTPVKNQAPAPTCEAYALCASLETLVQYQIGYPIGCDLSETHLFFYSGGTCESGGVLLGDTAEYLIDNGVPDEGCSPDPHRPYDYPFESLQGWVNRSVKIQEWGWVENNIEEIKHALIEHGPLIIHIIVRKDFNLYTRGIYLPINTDMMGGHVLTLIGYDDEQRCWIVKNSAGENWGEEGYVRISYDVHSKNTPFFWPFYGGTGILYIDEIYGNFKPDVPKIIIEKPKIFHTYVFGYELPTLFNKISTVQKAAPRIIGMTQLQINTSNSNKSEVYVDEVYQASINKPIYEISLDISKGLHTIEIFAYDNRMNFSKGEIDVFVL